MKSPGQNSAKRTKVPVKKLDMADKVDMSLDDIIAMNKKEKRRGGAGGGGRGRSNARDGRGGARRGTETPRGGRGAEIPRGGRGGGGSGKVQKPRRGWFGHTRQLNDDAMWEHDMYNGGRGKSQITRPYTSITTRARLIVSNLHFAVNDEDIQGLFAECGALKRSTVNYDKSGRSLGTAMVVFERRSDALEAMKQYNKVPLDGLPMQIELMGGALGSNNSSRDSARSQNNRSQHRHVGRDGGGGRERRGGRNVRKVPTAE